MPEPRRTQIRDIRDREVEHAHMFVLNGDRYLCPVPGCWWNGQESVNA